MPNHAIILISCPDQRGITAAVTGFVYEHNGNIVHADQHIDNQSNTFFMRIEWALEGFDTPEADIQKAFAPIAERFTMDWDLYFTAQKKKVAVFVSRPLHCLQDILLRYEQSEFPCDLRMIISNHEDARPLAERSGIPFHHLPVTPENKQEQEARQMQLLKQGQIDLIVLARYHQILSRAFVDAYPQRIINIHHSFLPAFQGRDPYDRAFRQGVKIIGATSHFVVEELDAGPIIEQDTVRVSHRDTTGDFKSKGRDLEKAVLSRTLRWALENKILSYGSKTVVFD